VLILFITSNLQPKIIWFPINSYVVKTPHNNRELTIEKQNIAMISCGKLGMCGNGGRKHYVTVRL